MTSAVLFLAFLAATVWIGCRIGVRLARANQQITRLIDDFNAAHPRRDDGRRQR
jgi:hypothetical protein